MDYDYDPFLWIKIEHRFIENTDVMSFIMFLRFGGFNDLRMNLILQLQTNNTLLIVMLLESLSFIFFIHLYLFKKDYE